MYMKFNGDNKRKTLSLIIATLIFMGGASSSFADKIPKTPENFALPFGLEGIQEINSKALPNLVFLIDNSKRTGETLSSGSGTKLAAYKAAVKSFIEANTGKYRFGIATLYDIENHPESVSNVMLAKPDDPISTVLSQLDSIQVQAYEKAPIITSLTQVYKDMNDAIIYRCQQSHVYVISDGDSSGDNDDRLKNPTGDDVIFPEIAAFSKMKGAFDPYVPRFRKPLNGYWVDHSVTFNVGDAVPSFWPSRPNYGYPDQCSFGNNNVNKYGTVLLGPNMCFPRSPDGYSTYAHFDDKDTYWDSRSPKVSHKFDDPEYSVQSIYTSWFSSRETEVISPEKMVTAANHFRSEQLVSPETMAARGRGYYRDITSASGLANSIVEVAKKFKSNPSAAMGRYYVPDILIAGYNRPSTTGGYSWKDEEKVIYLDYRGNGLDPETRLKGMPILRAVNYPNRWASTFIFSQLDVDGTGKTEKYPEKINPLFAHNDSFAGRDVEVQLPAMSMMNTSGQPYLVNSKKGVKVIADAYSGGTAYANIVKTTDDNGLTNEDFGIESMDPDRLKKTWPFYFTIGTGPNYYLFNNFYPSNSSGEDSLRMYHIRPNILSSYSTLRTIGSSYDIYSPRTTYDESYEPTTGAMENGVMYSNSFLAYGNKQRYGAMFSNNDTSSETGGGTVGMSIGVTQVGAAQAKQWTDKHYVLYGATRTTPARPSFQATSVSSTNNGVVTMYDSSTWGIAPMYSYIPGAIERENNETILQARTKAKHMNYGDEDHPFQYVLNGQFAGVESRSYEYTAESGYNSTAQNIVVGTVGQGGKGIFSLNGQGWLAHTSFQEPVILLNERSTNSKLITSATRDKTIKTFVNWDSANNPHTGEPMKGLEKIGYTIGQPMLAQMSMRHSSRNSPNVKNDVRILAFVGNGYNGTENKPSLYVIDAAGADFGTAHELPVSTDEMGKVLKKIEMPVPEDNAKSNALNGVALVDLDFNGVSDIGYVGDYNGNLYRLDFRGATIDAWTATLIYKGNPSQPITTTPTIFKDSKNSVTVIFGTGSQIYKEDSMDTSIQSIYGIKDVYNVADPKVITYASRAAELTKQDLTEDKSQQNIVRTVTSRPLGTNSGWYIDLRSESKPLLGERVISNMEVTENTLLVTSYYIKPEYLGKQQSEAICSVPMGYAGTWQMQVDAKTGGALTEFNANTGKITLDSSGLSVYSAGMQYMDRIPPVNITTTKNLPYNSQGQVLPGGKLYTPGRVFEPKACDGSDIMISVGNITGSSDTIGGQAIQCAKVLVTNVKRLSWRIIH